jgi:hypothetical protein
MSKRTNTPIGEVTCPHKGCDQVCKIYRFRPRTVGRKTLFTGKHYAECPVHGRIGSDGNPAVTDYILTEGKIWGPAAPEKRVEKSAPAHAPARKTSDQSPRKAPGKTPERPKPAPEQTSKRRWWEPVI